MVHFGLGETMITQVIGRQYYQKNVPTQIGTDTDWQKIDVYEHNLAIKTNGTLWVWGGPNGDYRLGDNTTNERLAPFQLTSVSNITKTSAGGHFFVCSRQQRKYFWFGMNSDGVLGTGDALTNRHQP